jgi:hypothetical protein
MTYLHAPVTKAIPSKVNMTWIEIRSDVDSKLIAQLGNEYMEMVVLATLSEFI